MGVDGVEHAEREGTDRFLRRCSAGTGGVGGAGGARGHGGELCFDDNAPHSLIGLFTNHEQAE
ncbi:hypothetical protein [Streptomyces mirabilis]|uniref:hypothetical protein n=1 Tax=Streptomyces mirabilis TaxID=68239 RepID=UPI00331D16C1